MKLHTLGCLLSLMTAVATTSPARAITYQWPVLNSVDVTLTSTGAVYHLKWSAVAVTDPTITETMTPEDVYTMKKGLPAGPTSMISAVRHRHKYAGGVEGGDSYGTTYTGLNEKFVDWAPRVTAKTMAVSEVKHTGDNGGECVGLIVSPNADAYGTSWDTLVRNSWDGGIGGAGSCLGTPLQMSGVP